MHEFNTDIEYFFNTSTRVMTKRPLSRYLKTFQIPRNKLYKYNNKKLLLIGGGNSPIQHTFNRLKINCDITNIDPYITNQRTANTNIKLDFNDTQFTNEFDEIWAMFSLPLYSPDVTHAVEFYRRAIIALKPGGTLLIGGHPRTFLLYDANLACKVHFPITYNHCQLLDLHLSTNIFDKYTSKPKLYDLYEKYTAPKSTTQKNKLNEHICNTR